MPTRSAEVFARIAGTIAGGESSYARMRAGSELVMARAAGARIEDVDGRSYLDYCGGYGVNLFGHAPPFVLDAVRKTLSEIGVHVAYPHRLAGDVGELVVELVPSIEQLRFAASGTEATQAAVRLARAATGRDLILKLEGHYHGWADHLCAGWGPGTAARPAAAASPGVPAAALASVWVVPFNDVDALCAAVADAGERLAGIVLEPVTGSGGLIAPTPAFLDEVFARVRDAGGLVIFDEVMTGFRVAPGGGQELLGLTPDLTVLGKVLGAGFGLAAFGGSRELMRLEAENVVVHGGTTTGSPVALAAARAVLSRLRDEPELYDTLEATSAALAAGVEAAFDETGVPGHVRRTGSMLQPFLSARPAEGPRSVAEAAALQDDARFAAFCDALEERGVLGHRYPLGRWFVSLAHTRSDMEETVAAVADALAAVAREHPPSG